MAGHRVRGDATPDERLARLKRWERERSRLIRAYGGRSPQVRRHLRAREPVVEVVEGVEPVSAAYWVPGLFHAGTVPMFEREGCRAVAVVPSARRPAAEPTHKPAQIVMQKTL